jgi:hypothetical protein
MLREPSQIEKVEAITPPRKDPRKSRFQLVRLEERIAPRGSNDCHTNPRGNKVGNC